MQHGGLKWISILLYNGLHYIIYGISIVYIMIYYIIIIQDTILQFILYK